MNTQNHQGIGDNYYIEGNVDFNNLPKIRTSLAEIVNELANLFSHTDDINSEKLHEGPDPRDKISYNNVVAYEGIIDTYKVYYGKLNKIYKTFEIEGSDKKRVILKNLKTLYLKERDRLRKVKDITKNEVREEYSDLILENIVQQLIKDIRNSNNLDITFEEAREGIYAIVVDGFIKCKILENPNN